MGLSAQNKLWTKQAAVSTSAIKSNKRNLPKNQTYSLNIEDLKHELTNVPQRENLDRQTTTILSFPNPAGVMERFRVFEASVMDAELQARYPEIRSYAGQGIDDPTAVIRFSVSPLGFSSMRLSAKAPASFIEPITLDGSLYAVYERADRIAAPDDFECTVTDVMNENIGGDQTTNRNADDGILRRYRLAVSTTGEYTSYHGGTKALALAAINTTMTRVNGIFENDFNVTMVLISNNDDVIYTNSVSDPYTNSNGYNSEVQTTLTSVIGEINYDVGHLFARDSNNGNAGCIGCICIDGQKGSGFTSRTDPEGDPFDVDYVAHELGHQFGGNHTFTFRNESGTGAQMEPGSGTTIMGYAGITGATDVQSNSDPYFHARSIEQITNNIKSKSCQTNINTGNAVPTVSAGANYTIPKGTAFVLTGSGTDANSSDVLTYCWEQYNTGNSSGTYPSTTRTSGVAFRSYSPTTDTKRYFPRLETIKTGSTSWQWEAVPNVARTLNFRMTVRDNRAGGANNNSDDTVITVNGTAGPFLVNSPNSNLTWNAGTSQTVSWSVAGTTGNGVNAANVDILLSTDGGNTYPITLLANTPNDGSQAITVPNNQGNQNRIMVKGSNHIFFDISNTNFTISGTVACTATVPTGLTSLNVGSSTATLSWNAVTGATYDLRYREVGSPTWITITVSALSTNVTGLNPLTDYEAQVKSKCNGGANSAYSSSVFFTTIATPACIGAQITTFPYLETFDSGIGDWTQATGDSGNWTLDAGGTPSDDTGPSDDITGGGNYLYTEASTEGLGSNATVILNSPCYELSSLTETYFSFNYHMYGANMGTLNLEITSDNGDNWTNVFTANGDLGDQWIGENINLSSYIGQTVKFRFIGITGGGFSSDMAIDNIGISNLPILVYCNSNSTNTNFEYIDRVQLNTLNNNNSGAGTTSIGYSNFTSNPSLTTDLVGGTQYTITITTIWPTATEYEEAYSVWIDYNRDGDFIDPGEQVFSLTPTNTTPVSGSFTVPIDINYGSTRMRVSMKDTGVPTSCETFTYGEVEDYTVNLKYDGLLFTNNAWTPNPPSGTTSTDNALILDGIYDVNSNIVLNNLTVNTNATANVLQSQSIELAGNLVNNGNLVLNSTSTEYSSLIVNGTVTGDAVYKRHVNVNASSGGNDLISAPLTGQTFGAFAAVNTNIVSNPNNTTEKLFGHFDKGSGTYITYDANVPAEAAITLNPAIGYRAASTDDGTFEFRGTVNTESISAIIQHSGTTYTEWNLIGNPYPSYIKLSDFLNTNINEFYPSSAAIYGYNGQASGQWKILNLASLITNPNAIITPGQGFLVASKDGGGTMVFNPSFRTIASGDALLDDDYIEGRDSDPADYAYLKIEMTSGTSSFSTDIYFTQNASRGLDVGYDASAFNGTAPNYAIYSHLIEGSNGLDMSIQSVSYDDLNSNIVVPLGINANQGQQISISLSNMILPTDIEVYLEDNLYNTFTHLNSSNYNFTADSNLSGIGRFFLRFEASTLNTADTALNEILVYATAKPKELVVKGTLLENTQAVLFDMQGRQILSQALNLNINLQTIDLSNISSGVYVVELQNRINSFSKKIIIK